MAKQPKGEVVVPGFDYSSLEAEVEGKVRSSADTIRKQMMNTAECAMKIGQELLDVKKALPHGQFRPWLHAEFGWSERTAQYLMGVAKSFKSAKLADLPIQPSAAYLLAAPAVPDQARQVAIEKAEAGEEITYSGAKEIVAEARKKGKKKAKPVAPDKLALRLVNVLERYKERWNQKELAELAQKLRDFADELDPGQKGGKKKARK